MSWEWIVGVVGALSLLGVLAAAKTRSRWLRWLRLRRRPFLARHPIVLVHGIMGFDEIRVGNVRHEYFRGVTARLSAHGNEVHRPSLPSVASVRKRAEALREFVDGLPSRRVILIAHSMGGLDARFAIAHLGMAKNVRALITIGTPHRGTPVADVGTGVAAALGLRGLSKAVGVDFDAFEDLTSQKMHEFNRDVADARGVLYASVIGKAGARVHPLLRATHGLMRKRGRDNDGLVPASSQAWGEVLFEVDADHWGQVGWSEGFDAAALYESIVRELRARGM